MGLEKNTTITEQDNAERSRQVLENQTREELHKQHGQELDAKRDISAQPENLSSSSSAVKQPEKSARDKLDNRSTIEDAGCTEDKVAKTISAGEMDAGIKLERNNVIDRQQGLSENKDKESGTTEKMENNSGGRNGNIGNFTGNDSGGDGPGGPPDPPEKPEKLKSKFDGENFTKENSYDARATQETRDLVSKSVTPIREYNFGKDVKAGEQSEVYTKDEIQTLKAEREKVDAPNETTVMQKVIGVCNGYSKDDVKKDLDAYFNPKNREGYTVDAQVWGYVSKAEDSAPFTKTPEECYNNLRLDYDGTKFKTPDESVYVIRFTDGKNYEIPYNSEFGGENMDRQPCTGNGYIGNSEHLVPEYKVYPEKDNGAVITDGNIYRINPDGAEEKVATYNNKDKCFELVKEEVR